MDELTVVSLIHFYDVGLREMLCGLRGFEHRSSKYARNVTCPACVGLLIARRSSQAASSAGSEHGSVASA
jgi:hypothetical protein